MYVHIKMRADMNVDDFDDQKIFFLFTLKHFKIYDNNIMTVSIVTGASESFISL